jgi:hypothetical protein
MNNKVRWLRISYWIGAIIDGIVFLRMLFPDTMPINDGLAVTLPTDALTRFAVGPGAALMIGWTVLLIWADRKPLERKGVLLITVFPVIVGIALANLTAVVSDIATLKTMGFTFVVQACLVALFTFSYWNAREAV